MLKCLASTLHLPANDSHLARVESLGEASLMTDDSDECPPSAFLQDNALKKFAGFLIESSPRLVE